MHTLWEHSGSNLFNPCPYFSHQGHPILYFPQPSERRERVHVVSVGQTPHLRLFFQPWNDMPVTPVNQQADVDATLKPMLGFVQPCLLHCKLIMHATEANRWSHAVSSCIINYLHCIKILSVQGMAVQRWVTECGHAREAFENAALVLFVQCELNKSGSFGIVWNDASTS